MRTLRSLLLTLLALSLVLGSSGQHSAKAATAQLAGMAMDIGKFESEKSPGQCLACGKSDIAKLACLPICISAPAIVPEDLSLHAGAADETISPIGGAAMSGSIRAPDPYPPRTRILA